MQVDAVLMDDEAHSRAYPATYTPSYTTAPQVPRTINFSAILFWSKRLFLHKCFTTIQLCSNLPRRLQGCLAHKKQHPPIGTP